MFAFDIDQSAARSMDSAHARQAEMIRDSLARHMTHARKESDEATRRITDQFNAVIAGFGRLASPATLTDAWMAYSRDVAERTALMTDILRQRGDIFLEHEAAGAPPVLIYDYEVVLDGSALPRPCNYVLLKILPKPGVEVHEWKRPYVIIDPRAGHGPGIGGFKPDSQVGVAHKDGHPVYFVAFRPTPVPGQTLADITHAEAAFLREVRRLHPSSPKPMVVGNCQGGWATAILAATNPDLTGPIVLNGAPMSYWSGRIGQDPMRYTGGVVGGVLPAVMVSDLGGGVFDGANLVMNFEMLNPGRTWFRKYYDVFAAPDGDPEHFLEFEKWWGGFFLMNEQEIRWIVENLFVGNRLAKNEARLETGRPIDLKAIRAPVIVFASWGDNITPPQQALNWIVDTYADEREIEIHGQRIVYMVHEQVGHLGIFVSSSVARREHTQMASTVKTIEALSPGLYEMVISDIVGEGHEKTFTVDFRKQTLNDLRALGGDRAEEGAFAAVARLSENLAETYETTLRPAVRAMVSPAVAGATRMFHPMRMQRSLFASANPAMAQVKTLADQVRADRRKVDEANPFLLAERLWADMTELSLNAIRDYRAMACEVAFLAAYANPLAIWYGLPHAKSRTLKRLDELRSIGVVQTAIDHIETGGLAEGIVRMLVLLANTRGDVRRDRLERSAEVLSTREPFVSMDSAARARMIHEQTLIARFEPELGMKTLPILLKSPEDRAAALQVVGYIVGSEDEMEPRTLDRMSQLRALFDGTVAQPDQEAAE